MSQNRPNRKAERIELRVTPQEKVILQRKAKAAGLPLGAWLLHKGLTDHSDNVDDLIELLRFESLLEPLAAELEQLSQAQLKAKLAKNEDRRARTRILRDTAQGGRG